MKKKSLALTTIVIFVLLTLSISNIATASPAQAPALLQSSLPDIDFLGEGPETFTVEPPLKLLVKTYENGEFLFVLHEENSYTAQRSERVWSTNFLPEESIRLFDEERSFGSVEAGCEVNYVQIEDNLDDRRNSFYINGTLLQTVEQGMVTYGSFTVPESGELTFYAEDSVGLIVELCLNQQTETPPVEVTDTPEVTTTATVPGITVTPEVTETGAPTATFTPSMPPTDIVEIPSETPTTALTVVPGASVTPTPTATTSVPGATATPTVPGVPGQEVSPTPTATGPAPASTATRVPTPAGGIPLSGGVPGPREVAWMGFALIAGLAVVSAAWWRLFRWYRNGK